MKKVIAVFLTALILCSCSRIDTERPVISGTADNNSSVTIDETGESMGIASESTPESETDTLTEPPDVPASILKEKIDYADFDRKIAECAEKNNVVGMGLCVFADGEVIYEIDLGYADKENEIMCDNNTIYRVASVSKLVSTMALMTLYDEGKIDPYSDLEELTGLPYNSGYSENRVLLWNLLTHTAGLADGNVYLKSASNYYDVSYVMRNSRSGGDVGKNYLYTNFGAGTIGSIVETITGEYFHRFASRVIFDKLDMNAAYCADLLKDRSLCANVYQYGKLRVSPKSWGRSSGYYERFGLGNSYLNAQCELLISPKDLAKLGIVISGDGSVDEVSILSKEAVDLINTPYFKSDSIPFDMGLCTRIYNGNLIEGRRIFGHSGSAYGNVCGLYYDPETKTGIALCTSGCNIGADPKNGVFYVIEDCMKCVYDTFFTAPQNT